MVVFNPFGTPIKTVYAPVANLERRVEMSAEALEQAERDLDAARRRASVDDDRKKERVAKLEREATTAERKRIVSILYSPVAMRHPRIAKRVALESDSPACEAIEALEQYERDHGASNAKALSDQIVHMGKVRRGEVDSPVTGVGPKNLVKATAEEILAAGRKARGEA